jgi:hypothetical protein
VLTAAGVESETGIRFAGLHQVFFPPRHRLTGLPPVGAGG